MADKHVAGFRERWCVSHVENAFMEDEYTAAKLAHMKVVAETPAYRHRKKAPCDGVIWTKRKWKRGRKRGFWDLAKPTYRDPLARFTLANPDPLFHGVQDRLPAEEDNAEETEFSFVFVEVLKHSQARESRDVIARLWPEGLIANALDELKNNHGVDAWGNRPSFVGDRRRLIERFLMTAAQEAQTLSKADSLNGDAKPARGNADEGDTKGLEPWDRAQCEQDVNNWINAHKDDIVPLGRAVINAPEDDRVARRNFRNFAGPTAIARALGQHGKKSWVHQTAAYKRLWKEGFNIRQWPAGWQPPAESAVQDQIDDMLTRQKEARA